MGFTMQRAGLHNIPDAGDPLGEPRVMLASPFGGVDAAGPPYGGSSRPTRKRGSNP